jgi:hypothetical protein
MSDSEVSPPKKTSESLQDEDAAAGLPSEVRTPSLSGKSLLQCIEDKEIDAPELMDVNQWQRWRRATRSKVAQAQIKASSNREVRLWRDVMRHLYGDAWKDLLEEKLDSELAGDQEPAAEDIVGESPATPADGESPAAEEEAIVEWASPNDEEAASQVSSADSWLNVTDVEVKRRLYVSVSTRADCFALQQCWRCEAWTQTGPAFSGIATRRGTTTRPRQWHQRRSIDG